MIMLYDFMIDCYCELLLNASNSEHSGGNVLVSSDNLKELRNVVLLDCLAARGDYARLGATCESQ